MSGSHDTGESKVAIETMLRFEMLRTVGIVLRKCQKMM
jgi:hypothetical protein